MLVVRVLTLLICFTTTLLAQQQWVDGVVVVQLRAGSAAELAWKAQGRRGEIAQLTTTIGSHTSTGYISNATLASVQRARRSQRKTDDDMQATADVAVGRFVRIGLPPGTSIEKCLAALRSHPDVVTVERLPVYTVVGMPNDTLAPRQYHLALVQAFQAWDELPADSTVVIGIVDTGIERTHDDLRDVMYTNPGETGTDAKGRDKRSNGIDDDGNGFVDDFQGWDFVSGSDTANGDNDPSPGNPHGTHVGGTAGASINNIVGGAGVAAHVRLMPVKIGADDQFSRTVSNTADGILYAASNNAAVINCSFGASSQTFADVSVINEATSLGALIICAAGNDGVDQAFYPAAYPACLSVAATDANDRLTSFSNIHRTIDVAAPGKAILATYPNNSYESLDGTSMASPIVTATAAMVRLTHPTFTPEQVHATIKASATNVDTLNLAFVGRMGTGRVNAFEAARSVPRSWASISSVEFTDSDGDGLYEPGEDIHAHITIKNILQPLRAPVLHVSSATFDVALIIAPDSITLPAFATGEERAVQQDIIISLPLNTPQNSTIELLCTMVDSTTTVLREIIGFNANPTYRTIAENDISVTVNSSGNFAFNDYPNNDQGTGFSFRDQDGLLFESGLMIGTSSSNVSNVVRGFDPHVKDTSFHTINVINIRRDSVPSGLRAVTMYSDSSDVAPSGVVVHQQVFQSNDDSVRNVITTCYDITNVTSTTIGNAYAALFFDWDIGRSGAYNQVQWDYPTGAGMQANVAENGLPIVGVSMVSPYITNFYAIDNPGHSDVNVGIYDDFVRSEKWYMMTNGINRTKSSVTDASMVIGGGPFSIAPGETTQICFVIGAGATYDELASGLTAGRARAQSMGLNAIPYQRIADQDQIIHVANGPTLQPGPTTVKYSIHRTAMVTLDLVDLFGRSVATYRESLDPAGIYEFEISIPNVAAGNYFLRLHGSNITVSLLSIVR